MANFLTGIISLSISVVVLANVYITSVKQSAACMNGTSIITGATACNGTAGYGSYPMGAAMTPAETAMWGLLTLVGIVGLVYGVMSVFGIM
jgi:hypothetical protein